MGPLVCGIWDGWMGPDWLAVPDRTKSFTLLDIPHMFCDYIVLWRRQLQLSTKSNKPAAICARVTGLEPGSQSVGSFFSGTGEVIGRRQ